MTPKAIKAMSLKKLVELFTLTGSMTDENIPTVRGWLMNAIEEKNPEGFENWLDSENCADEELASYVL